MKKPAYLIALCLLLNGTTLLAQHTDYPIQPVPFTQVKFTDQFWMPRIKTNHTVTIPASFDRCENTGRVKNFEMAAARTGAFCTVFPFDDTDIYKTIEGASFSLSLFPDKKLELYIDTLIDKVAKAQEPDGYLYTARTIDPKHPHAWSGLERWEKERDMSHELYNSGHLFEAAAAHYQATGKKNLLNIALKNADLVCNVFGPDKMHVAPGHEIVEMGLVKLYRITGKSEYLATAKFFIDERGHYDKYDSTSKDLFKNGAYWQDHIPVKKQSEALGHAVRAGYLYAAVADIAALTGDSQYLEAIDRIWNNVVGKKMYVQGGIGSIGDGERFGENYELPNATAYNETCAAIANVYWNQRMFQLHGESKYIDILERSLYNCLLAGVGLDGKSFFYTNAMEVKSNQVHRHLEAARSGWFTCSCCPTNICRLMPSIPGYVYAVKGDAVYANLFVPSTSNITINGKNVRLTQENNYPWDGHLKFKIDETSIANFKLRIRIPGWATNMAIPSDLYTFASNHAEPIVIHVNGKPITYNKDDGYATIERKWKKGDVVELNLPMPVEKLVCNSQVADNIGKVSMQRGPLTYCFEWPDNAGQTSNFILSPDVTFTTGVKDDLFPGTVVIRGETPSITIDVNETKVSTTNKKITAIPYYLWANRGKGEMQIWIPEKIKAVDIISK